MGFSPRVIRSRTGIISRCQPEMWAAMSRADQVPHQTSLIWASLRPVNASLNLTNSTSAPASRSAFSDMRSPSADGARRDALVKEQLPRALGQVVDVAAGLKTQRRVHADGRGVGLLRGGEHAWRRRDRLDGLEELAGDALSTEVLPHHDQGHEGALEPVRPVREEAHDLLLGLGHDQVVALHVRLDEGARAVLADREGGQQGAAGGIGGAGQADLDHGAVKAKYTGPPWRAIRFHPFAPSVRAGADLLVDLLELVRREARRLAGGDDLPLVRLDFRDGLGDAARDLGGDRDHAVLVEVDDVARLDPDAAHLDGNAEVHHVDVGVGNRDVGGGELELERAHLVEVADGAVGDHADAAERAVDVRLHLAPRGPLAARLVEIVDEDAARGGDAHDEVPPAEEARAVPLDRAVLRPAQAGGGVADLRPELGEEPADLGGDVALLARPHLEGLDGVGHAGAGDLLEGVDLQRREWHWRSSSACGWLA